MQTAQEQRAFFEARWPAMREALEAGGPRALIDYVDAHEDEQQRRILYAFARQGIVMDEWAGQNLDAALQVARAGIAEILRQAETAPDDETRTQRRNLANAVSYDLAADLADCWPGDDLPRTRDHFEAGLRAAENCIRWREELNRPPRSRSMAWWAKGMHQLSLGDPKGARESWARSLEESIKAAADEGLEPATDPSTMLMVGYVAIADFASGTDRAADAYRSTIVSFQALGEQDPEVAEDAAFFVSQLEKVRERYAPSL